MPIKIAIINGPNLNLIGQREPEIYGQVTFAAHLELILDAYPTLDFDYFQSNHEGAIIDQLQKVGFSFDCIVLNAAGYTHTSIALMDTILAIDTPVIEVHISNTMEREQFRHHSYIAQAAIHTIMGKGLQGYNQAINWYLNSI